MEGTGSSSPAARGLPRLISALTDSLIASFAARWQISVTSAPEKPSVLSASCSRFTSAAIGDLRRVAFKMLSRLSRSGSGIKINWSRRPGRVMAGSRMSGLGRRDSSGQRRGKQADATRLPATAASRERPSQPARAAPCEARSAETPHEDQADSRKRRTRFVATQPETIDTGRARRCETRTRSGAPGSSASRHVDGPTQFERPERSPKRLPVANPPPRQALE
eukprot:GHVT01078289.1.p1 GENE.GHVT01078289.1~~GHVT01078289.1.p1  ORF type:complete len:222 (-),score=33.15 GHVT01078289.1:80-745(-)